MNFAYFRGAVFVRQRNTASAFHVAALEDDGFDELRIRGLLVRFEAFLTKSAPVVYGSDRKSFSLPSPRKGVEFLRRDSEL